jgi:hypothetical protein
MSALSLLIQSVAKDKNPVYYISMYKEVVNSSGTWPARETTSSGLELKSAIEPGNPWR